MAEVSALAGGRSVKKKMDTVALSISLLPSSYSGQKAKNHVSLTAL